ncbi:MAG: hypothetical protein VB036_08280 [Propionicimonas sp.]|nr:hypothetical protein [Propionicimonas sp.]
MPDFEDAFRQGLGRIDTLPSPLPPLDASTLAARAAAAHASPRRHRPPLQRLLVAAAAVTLVAGTAAGSWLTWGRTQDPVPARPAPSVTVTAAQLDVGPLTRTPSAHQVLVDDPALIHHEIAGEGEVPGGFFVGGDTVTVDDSRADRLAVYHGGEVVDSVTVPPDVEFSQFALWDDTWYLVGETLRAFIRQGDALVETSPPREVVEAGQFDSLLVEGDNLVAQRPDGKRFLVAGPGPLAPAPRLTLTDDGFTVADGAVDARIRVGGEPSGIVPLGRDADHVWYLGYDSQQGELTGLRNQGFVYEFATDGRLTASYTLDPRTTGVQIANGRVYALLVVRDVAHPAKDTVQVWELEPSPTDARPDADPADDCELTLIGVDPIACTQPAVTEQPIKPLSTDPGFYVLSAADGRIRCDVDGRRNAAACVTSYDLEPVDPSECATGSFDQNYVELSQQDGTWLGGQGGCGGRLEAESGQPPVLPVDAVLITGELAVFANADGITIWNHGSGSGFMISGERVHSW